MTTSRRRRPTSSTPDRGAPARARGVPTPVAEPGDHRSAGTTADRLLDLQATAGNAAVSAIARTARGGTGGGAALQRDRHRPTIDFDADEGTRLTTTASSPDTRLRQVHSDVGGLVEQGFENCKDGLDQFETAMSFASEQEAAPRLAEAMGKAFMKSMLDMAVDAIELPGLKQVVKTAIDVGMAAWDESERASGAAGERQIAAFIGEVRSGLSRSQTTALARHRGGRDAFLGTYPGDLRARVIEAEEEVWMARAEQQARLMERAVPDNRHVQMRLTERFAQTGAHVGLVTQGTWRDAGTLSIELEVAGSDADGWRVTSIDGAWLLGTDAPKPERVAQSLQDSLEGSSPMLSSLPVEIRIAAETGDDEFEGRIRRRGMGRASIDMTDTTRRRREAGRPVIRSVGRSPEVASRLLDVTRIRGSER